MRFTKTIEEYVRETLKEKTYPIMDEIRGDYNERKRKCVNELEDVIDACLKEVENVLERNGMDIDVEKSNMYDTNTQVITLHNYYVRIKETEDKISRKKNELAYKLEERVKEIRLEMELGGNRRDLERMLEETKFQYRCANHSAHFYY